MAPVTAADVAGFAAARGAEGRPGQARARPPRVPVPTACRTGAAGSCIRTRRSGNAAASGTCFAATGCRSTPRARSRRAGPGALGERWSPEREAAKGRRGRTDDGAGSGIRPQGIGDGARRATASGMDRRMEAARSIRLTALRNLPECLSATKSSRSATRAG